MSYIRESKITCQKAYLFFASESCNLRIFRAAHLDVADVYALVPVRLEQFCNAAREISVDYESHV